MLLDKIAIALISPLGTALILGAMALILVGFRKRRWAWMLGTTALVWLLAWSLPVASNRLQKMVEMDYPPVPIEALPHAQALVVLGGCVRPAEVDGPGPDLSRASDRLWHTARVYHAGKAPLVVLSGGSRPEICATSEAEAMRQHLLDLGVPTGATLLEEHSRNTRQNASFTADILRERGVTHILLVTSALHMRRAIGQFQAQGLTVTPAATDHEARSHFDWEDWLPDAHALDASARTLKEIIGVAAGR